ncbi:DNA polymerase/3'-5' exonuclease PolX [Candidatus Bipolaricaulota bacterium]|nr:DNA polymerase/3'-5' exonuclease PolX [Candidatus Bipolaricaulota bacterium]
MKNRLVAKILYEVADLLELEGVEFKPRAYRRAAQAVESCPIPIEDLVAQGRLHELPGVGESIARKIEEIVKTGKLALHEELKAKLPVDLYALTQVEGVGPKTVKLLYEALGVRTLEDLERVAREGRIREVKGLGPKVEEKILRGLQEARGAEKRELLGYALPLARSLCQKLLATGLFKKVEPAGSLRRGKETVGDLDLLAISDRPEEAARAFCTLAEVEEVLAQGPKKSSVRLSGGLQADLRIVPEESFGAALQYFTGSKAHNIRLRERAVARGWKLNEYGLFDANDRLLAGRTEEEIYRALGLSYIPPELREDQGEIQAAEAGALPKLVELGEILGDLHVHTDWSDGKMSILEVVEVGRAQGLRYVAITDHMRFAQAIPGLSPEELRRQIEEIRRLNETLKDFRLLCGVEANIARDGTVDVPRDLLPELDLVIASVHTHFRLSKKEMTERLVRAVENEGVDVLGHPTGRLIGERPAYEADWDEVFRRAAKAGTALEINANPQRLDLPADLIRRALEYGVKFILGTDAHAADHFSFLEYGVLTLRRGWAESKDVLNTLPVEAVLSALKRGR